LLERLVHRELDQLVLGAEVVLHHSGRHAGLGGDRADGHAADPLAAHDPPERVAELPAPGLHVHHPRHPPTVPPRGGVPTFGRNRRAPGSATLWAWHATSSA